MKNKKWMLSNRQRIAEKKGRKAKNDTLSILFTACSKISGRKDTVKTRMPFGHFYLTKTNYYKKGFSIENPESGESFSPQGKTKTGAP